VLGGYLAWLAEGRAFYVLHDPWTIMSNYKRWRGREIVAETIAKKDPNVEELEEDYKGNTKSKGKRRQ
jgi:hypothetical protein